MTARYFWALALVLLFSLSACGGGNSSDTPAPAPIPNPPPAPVPGPTLWEQQTDAARLLTQATFGPSLSDINHVVDIGLEAWIDDQLSQAPSSHLSHLLVLESIVPRDEMWKEHRMEAWWNAVLFGDDQLRQRVAFALSEIMVISDRSNFSEDLRGMTNYYDLLAENAFGNYRELIEEVTRSPIMGMYLSMLGNEKPDSQRNIRPDENYARELMQLFSIGLIELNADGRPKLDANNKTIPTYDQTIIEAYAHVFTGWHFSGTTEQSWYYWWQNYETLEPMQAVNAYHAKSEKRLLNGIFVPANQSASEDLAIALDSLFNHDNVAPFISKHLIQRLVTSNPSESYVGRISAIFENNGLGERGDLGAVVKAILLDEEARSGHQTMPQTFGKIKEPILRATHLWRAFKVSSPNDRIQLGYPDYFFNQAPLSSPSVFNFFLPTYSEPGELNDLNMVAPELQIMTETFVVRTTNFMAYTGLWGSDQHNTDPNPEDMLVNYVDEVALINDPDALIEHLNLVLMSGGMSDNYQAILKEALAMAPYLSADERVANLVFLITSSPQFAVQH